MKGGDVCQGVDSVQGSWGLLWVMGIEHGGGEALKDIEDR